MSLAAAAAVAGSGLRRAASPMRIRMAAFWAAVEMYSMAQRNRSRCNRRKSAGDSHLRRYSASSGSIRLRKASTLTERMWRSGFSSTCGARAWPLVSRIRKISERDARTTRIIEMVIGLKAVVALGIQQPSELLVPGFEVVSRQFTNRGCIFRLMCKNIPDPHRDPEQISGLAD